MSVTFNPIAIHPGLPGSSTCHLPVTFATRLTANQRKKASTASFAWLFNRLKPGASPT
jgi:hypothetical protein